MSTANLQPSSLSERLSSIRKAPGKDMRRLWRIAFVLAISVLLGVGALILLVVLRPSDPKTLQALAAVVILSVGMSSASVYGLLITLWTFYLTERMERLRTEEEAGMQWSQVHAIMCQAVERIADKPEFEATLQSKLGIRSDPVNASLSPQDANSKQSLGPVVVEVVKQYVTMEVVDEAIDNLRIPDEHGSALYA